MADEGNTQSLVKVKAAMATGGIGELRTIWQNMRSEARKLINAILSATDILLKLLSENDMDKVDENYAWSYDNGLPEPTFVSAPGENLKNRLQEQLQYVYCQRTVNPSRVGDDSYFYYMQCYESCNKMLDAEKTMSWQCRQLFEDTKKKMLEEADKQFEKLPKERRNALLAGHH